MTHLNLRISRLPCLFHLLIGFYCPGCGGTRAIKLLLKGDLAGSFQYHPLVLYGLLIFGIECILFLAAFKRQGKTDKGSRFWLAGKQYCSGLEKRYRFWTLAATFIVLLNWLIKNIWLMAGIDLLPPLA